MPIFAEESGKQFTKLPTGKYLGTIIDVVDLGLCAPKNPNPAFNSAPVRRVQIVWAVTDAEGNSHLHSEAPPNKLGEGGGKYKPTRLFEIVTGVLGPIPQPYAALDVETLLGKANELFIVKTGDGNDARSSVAGFLPFPPNATPPAPPAGFVRKINKPVAATAAPAQGQAVPAQAKEVSF